MTRRSAQMAIAVSLVILGWSACRSSPNPGSLFSDAEALRTKYEKEASRQAIGKYRQAIAEWERQGFREDAARAWQRLGRTYEQLGSLSESLAAYEAALALVRESSPGHFKSEILSDVGVARALAAADASVLNNAREECTSAEALARQGGHNRELAKALNCLGEVAYFDQDYERALQAHIEAGHLFDALGDELGQAHSHLLVGHVYSDLGRISDAQGSFDRAYALWSRLGDRREQAIVSVAKARLDLRRGNYQAALNQFQQALISLQPMGDSVWEGSCYGGIAQIYRDLGDADPALKYWEFALERFETAGLKIFAVDTLMSLGATYLGAGDHGSALTRFERALAMAEDLKIDRWKAWALRFIGVVHLVRRVPDKARDSLDRAAQLARNIGDPRLDRHLRADLGETHDLLAQPTIAVRYFN